MNHLSEKCSANSFSSCLVRAWHFSILNPNGVFNYQWGDKGKAAGASSHPWSLRVTGASSARLCQWKEEATAAKKEKNPNNRPLQSYRRVRLVFKRRCFWRRTPTGCVYPFMRIIDGFALHLFGRQWILLEVAWHASWFDNVEECVRKNERGENLVQGVCFTSSHYAKQASGISGIRRLILKGDAWKALCQPCPTSLATWPHWSNQNIPLMTSI